MTPELTMTACETYLATEVVIALWPNDLPFREAKTVAMERATTVLPLLSRLANLESRFPNSGPGAAALTRKGRA